MNKFISQELVENYFLEIEKHLLNKENIIPFQLSRPWIKTFTKNAGVYCFFIKDELCYVGESGCLYKRFADLLNTKNHTLRRTIGEIYFGAEVGFIKANSKNSFPSHIESKVIDWIEKNLQFSHCAVDIGRKEFEEWLQYKHSNVKFLNKRGKRES